MRQTTPVQARLPRSPHLERERSRLLRRLIEPPRGPHPTGGLWVAAHSRPLDPVLSLGGDWHLSTVLPDGDVLLSVGDVMGHGFEAAAEMLALRYALAAFAAEGMPPGRILQRLNNVLCTRDPGITTTTIVARFRPADFTLTWAQAGHPAMFLARPREVVPLPRPAGLILGVVPDEYYAEASLVLPDDSLLCLYTDGVVERRLGSDGTARLRAGLHPSLTDPSLLLEPLDRGTPADDACVLLARRSR